MDGEAPNLAGRENAFRPVEEAAEDGVGYAEVGVDIELQIRVGLLLDPLQELKGVLGKQGLPSGHPEDPQSLV